METKPTTGRLASFVERNSTALSILAAGAFIAMAISVNPSQKGPAVLPPQGNLQEAVLPAAGVTLPITWGELGKRLVEVGAIDPAKLAELYKQRGGIPDELKKMLETNVAGKVVITSQNAGYLLNLLWALGLANKNPILEEEMKDPRYGETGNFAATGGWTLSTGKPMEHYGAHELISLTPEQQAIVDRVSRNIYRPCCGNSTHFPDCNHGMAMLAFLELMASQGVSEQDMYKAALVANSYWFPATYLTIAEYEREQGIDWKDVSAQEVLGAAFSSASGYQQISAKVKLQPQAQTGGGCSA